MVFRSNLDAFAQVPRVARAADTSDCQTWGCSALSVQWLQTRGSGTLLNVLQRTGWSSTATNDRAADGTSIKSEDLWFRLISSVLAVAVWCQNPLFYLRRNFPVWSRDCLTLAPSMQIFAMPSLMRCVPSSDLCKVSSPQYPEMAPFMLTLAPSLSLFQAWHCALSQLPLWSIHARSEGTGKSHLQVKMDLKTNFSLV